jgi:hypothetical protein
VADFHTSILVKAQATIHEPKIRICLMGWSRSAGSGSSAAFLPRWKAQRPWGSPLRGSPQAAKTFSFQA